MCSRVSNVKQMQMYLYLILFSKDTDVRSVVNIYTIIYVCDRVIGKSNAFQLYLSESTWMVSIRLNKYTMR